MPLRALARLQHATLDDLRREHPADWEAVSGAVLAALAAGPGEEAARWYRGLAAGAEHWRGRLRASGGNPAVASAALPHLVRERMARLALEKTALAIAARQASGTVRLGRWSGLVIQRLLFARGLERKAVSHRAFRLWWPLLPDRRLLMPLVQQRGIYCFYTRELVRRLAALLDGRPCLELAAGDGSLARLLAAEGARVTATDDGSWAQAAPPRSDVERLEARAALRERPAPVVLCSWPPAGNRFERAVFDAPGVELYVALGSRHRFATGDWAAYEQQRAFDWAPDPELSRLVVPPELDPAVLVFRRRR